MPEPLKTLTSGTVVFSQSNIDTDQIIPGRFLTTTTREGLGAHAFHDWRYEADGSVKPEAVLNRIDPTEHRILIAGDNFACGSSREHAPWALLDYGFRAVVSTSIADIFTSNALKNGLLPVVVSQAVWDDLAAHPDQPVTIDLEAETIRRGNAEPTPFRVESFARQCLLDGVDAMGWLTARLPDIEAFERRQQETA
ncbi:3-isopropylmalate dehydratase small subunit [Brevundimonas sp. BAL450]|jgi:3-isopropylmalate/(R)-2-methylmalate dehydratase small subunit|uniref:3-isopropylmalate dehydratase n=1 Tax=Brevundimonas abyssalis TAR-001 TaxID=1391729 RepID=A0A8E0KJS6_9CAUL|nr:MULTISPECIES: 3-isopropylmalate dehydratase small subunit [Brevundimonas]MBG7616601.1 3-isopropylmalate dehydratase small subunit [Brevundimonas sp. BAL450]GAD57752.1 3-isopropylmalate dehydratase small subunit [Brevundimonas abyssalis TAR-001]